MPIVRVSIAELTDEYLKCRHWGHDWDEYPSAVVDSERYRTAFAIEAVRCTRCTMERIKYYDEMLVAIGSPYYRRPPGYDTIVGQGSRPNVRFELFGRGLVIHQVVQVAKARRGARKANEGVRVGLVR